MLEPHWTPFDVSLLAELDELANRGSRSAPIRDWPSFLAHPRKRASASAPPRLRPPATSAAPPPPRASEDTPRASEDTLRGTAWHEVAHACVLVATGGQLGSIEVNADGSGTCYVLGWGAMSAEDKLAFYCAGP